MSGRPGLPLSIQVVRMLPCAVLARLVAGINDHWSQDVRAELARRRSVEIKHTTFAKCQRCSEVFCGDCQDATVSRQNLCLRCATCPHCGQLCRESSAVACSQCDLPACMLCAGRCQGCRRLAGGFRQEKDKDWVVRRCLTSVHCTSKDRKCENTQEKVLCVDCRSYAQCSQCGVWSCEDCTRSADWCRDHVDSDMKCSRCRPVVSCVRKCETGQSVCKECSVKSGGLCLRCRSADAKTVSPSVRKRKRRL